MEKPEFQLPLRSDTFRFLISCPAHLVGEYQRSQFQIRHAWPSDALAGLSLDHSRTMFIVSMLVQHEEPSNLAFSWQLSEYGAQICALMSVLYGKRFDLHGKTEAGGFFFVPDLSGLNLPIRRDMPHINGSPRADFPIPFNLEEVERIAIAMFSLEGPTKELEEVKRKRDSFVAACEFYHLALKQFELHPEISYMNLVSAGEVIAFAEDVNVDLLIDERWSRILEDLKRVDTDELKLLEKIKPKIHPVRQRFKLVVRSYLDEGFFLRTESELPSLMGALSADEIEKGLLAAYDLRSKFVHAGTKFGDSIRRSPRRSEVPIGKISSSDRELDRALNRAPTFIGLERIIRYVILRFGERQLGIRLTQS